MSFFNRTDKQLWRLALPMILSNISVPLLGLVDTAVIGHLNSAVYLGGVAVATTITSFLFMLLLFLRMSTTGLTAQAWGGKNNPALVRALVQPMIVSLLAGVLFLLFRQPLSHLATLVIGGDPAILQQAREFIDVRWLSAPATFANLVILGWLLGVQYARAPVILLVAGNLVNIILELLLVLHLHMGVRGAAGATVIAEYVTLLTGMVLVWRVLNRQGIQLRSLPGGWRGDIKRVLGLNRDILLRSLLLQICFASLTMTGARLGGDIVAVNALLMMFLSFTSYALDGFAYAVEAVSGEAYGARQSGRLPEVWHASCRQAGIVAVAFSLIYALAGPYIVNMLTSLPSLRQLADHYLIWQVILPIAGVGCYLLDGLFVGATRGKEMRNSMAVAAVGFGLTLCTIPWLGNHGVWLALCVFMLLRGITLWRRWNYHQRHQSWFAP
ncbi:MATE family efflux transporter DinF [Tatumella citrea]|uniref:MATE family efflux transporter DinF n=1 Tax=Tatumella citrea TaxID=53336 RepID=A0A1Y0LNC7_TATCI|nr:MATE family efflux transporter DinF [Tatumella citrea]ARU95492.1 MATE family efflux transporter DinF [Tatumella citrea]ARU99533.1 MATE family efflux transporter DinF [Tatumella citrea]